MNPSDALQRTLDAGQPLILSFLDLVTALAPLHRWEKRHVDTLHDLWKRGAPTPDSIILHPEHYDERQQQAGNRVTRILSPLWVAQWMRDVSGAQGMPFDLRQCLNILDGRADYGVDFHPAPLLFEMKPRGK